jgi:hypothetical protein
MARGRKEGVAEEGGQLRNPKAHPLPQAWALDRTPLRMLQEGS